MNPITLSAQNERSTMTNEEQPPQSDDQLQPLVIDNEHKTWFIDVLEDFGFQKVADAIKVDESDAWFTRMFIGLVQGLHQTSSMIQEAMGMPQQHPGQQQQSQQGIAVLETDKRIMLPGDQGFSL